MDLSTIERSQNTFRIDIQYNKYHSSQENYSFKDTKWKLMLLLTFWLSELPAIKFKFFCHATMLPQKSIWSILTFSKGKKSLDTRSWAILYLWGYCCLPGADHNVIKLTPSVYHLKKGNCNIPECVWTSSNNDNFPYCHPCSSSLTHLINEGALGLLQIWKL